jgi:copper(I)-binding protein
MSSSTICLALALSLTMGVATPQDQASNLTVSRAWSRATAPSAQAGAVFLVISNSGSHDDALRSVAAACADTVELHSHTMDDQGIMHMDPVASVAIPAHGAVEFKPGGLHIMLLGLKHPLHLGDHLALILHFDHAGTIPADALVMAPDAMGLGSGAPAAPGARGP